MKNYDGMSDALREALWTGNYICSQCGGHMSFTDEYENVLMCDKCFHNIPLERYGAESDEEFYALYPTKEEICGFDPDDEDEDEEDEDE